MDEAERCTRVGLMHLGRLLLCDSPANLRASIPEECYAVEVADPRGERTRLATLAQVKSARPAGSALHVFLRPGAAAEEVWRDGSTRFERISPSLEDVFVATVEAG